MTEWHLLLAFIMVLGVLLIWHSRRVDRLEKRIAYMQQDIGLLERQVVSLRSDSHVHHGSIRRYL